MKARVSATFRVMRVNVTAGDERNHLEGGWGDSLCHRYLGKNARHGNPKGGICRECLGAIRTEGGASVKAEKL